MGATNFASLNTVSFLLADGSSIAIIFSTAAPQADRSQPESIQKHREPQVRKYASAESEHVIWD